MIRRVDLGDHDGMLLTVSRIRDRVERGAAAGVWTDSDTHQCLADRHTLLRIVDELDQRENRWMACCMESDEAGSLAEEARKLAEARAENCRAIVVAQEQTIRELSHKLGHMRDAANLVADSLGARARRHVCVGLDCPRCNPRQLIEELRCAVRDSQ